MESMSLTSIRLGLVSRIQACECCGDSVIQPAEKFGTGCTDEVTYVSSYINPHLDIPLQCNHSLTNMASEKAS
jgi:hypothetical protein